MTWRAIWMRAQITGIAVSSMVWLMFSALEPDIVELVWLLGALLVAIWPSRVAFWVRHGGRRVSPSERLLVVGAVAPIQRLRGRNEPVVWVSHRPGVGLAVGPRCVVVSRSVLDGLRSHRITDLQFATLAARSVGLLRVSESRLVAAVGLFCWPWSVMEHLFGAVVRRLPRPGRGPALLRWVPWLVWVLALAELYQRGLWVSLVMIVLLGVAMVTTPRCNRAWSVRREQLAQAGVARCGLAPLAPNPAQPDPWAFLFKNDEDRRRDREVWS